ncbi:MAG: carboxylating nicotinate-nucleotide diphosphorylase [Gammaproteobacteria bacterium]|nr:carboxylating nicotinate-nucleotide diphosphorylase [Gammaproteobacteria bacterium]
MNALRLPNLDIIRENVRAALAEDIGSGDVTARLLTSAEWSEATIICRQEAVISGIEWARETFTQVDPRIETQWLIHDSDRLSANTQVARLRGPAASLLTAERTALNFLQTLSGTATQARQLVDLIAGTHVTLLDTRKTIPGLRAAQKYAVTCGGCENHRHGLYDAILIKENHITAAGSITAAIHLARAQSPTIFLIVEVETFEELKAALSAKPDRILLDNFTPTALREAVTLTAGRIPLEASGNIRRDNIRLFAETGVNYLSMGTLTKDIKAIDLSLRLTNARF